MAVRAHSGKLVVLGLIVAAVGGTLALSFFTSSTPSQIPGLHLPTATPTGTVRVTPSSGPATPGVGRPVDITLPCGFVGAVDFDGSFWVPADGRSLASVGRRLVAPVDPATITLQAESSALVRTASGQVVVLVRSTTPTALNPAC